MQRINQVSVAPVVDAALHHLQAWLIDATPPPVQPRIDFEGEPPEVVRDDNRIARGGIRLPQVDVPIAHNSAHPAVARRLRPTGRLPRGLPRREGARALRRAAPTYLARYEAATRAAAAAGVILPRDVDPLLAEAEAAYPG